MAYGNLINENRVIQTLLQRDVREKGLKQQINEHTKWKCDHNFHEEPSKMVHRR